MALDTPAAVVELAETGYMASDYGEPAWRKIAEFLLKQGHTAHEAAAIMLSKHARWADDSQGRGIGKGTTSAAFIRYYNVRAERGHFDWQAEGRQMAVETFTDLPVVLNDEAQAELADYHEGLVDREGLG